MLWNPPRGTSPGPGRTAFPPLALPVESSRAGQATTKQVCGAARLGLQAAPCPEPRETGGIHPECFCDPREQSVPTWPVVEGRFQRLLAFLFGADSGMCLRCAQCPRMLNGPRGSQTFQPRGGSWANSDHPPAPTLGLIWGRWWLSGPGEPLAWPGWRPQPRPTVPRTSPQGTAWPESKVPSVLGHGQGPPLPGPSSFCV